MYIGPWQEYKLAKLHKDAVQAIQTLTAQLPRIHGGGADAGGLTTENVASVLAHFQDAMAGGPPRPHGRGGTASTSTSMPDINSHRRRPPHDSRNLRSASSTPGHATRARRRGHGGGGDGRDDDNEASFYDDGYDDAAGGGARRGAAGRPPPRAKIDTGRGRRRGKKTEKKKGYVTKAMREVNRRRELYMNPNKGVGATGAAAAGAGAAEEEGKGTGADASSASRQRVKLPPIGGGGHTSGRRREAEGAEGASGEEEEEEEEEEGEEEEDLAAAEQRALAAAGDMDTLPDMDDTEVDGMLDWVKALGDGLGDDADDGLGFDLSDVDM